MKEAIIFLGIPILIGYGIDKAQKRDGLGWFVGFLVGVALNVMFETLSGHQLGE